MDLKTNYPDIMKRPTAQAPQKITSMGNGGISDQPAWTPSAAAASESTLRHLVYAAAPQFAEQSSGGPPPPTTQYELVYSGTPNPQNAGKIDLENVDANTRLILEVRCGRQTPKKGDGAVSANVTNNGVNSIRGRKADGTAPPSGVSVLVPGANMSVTLNPNTGIVTINGQSENASWGDASFGTTVNMTVSGSGTSSVTITYVITGSLTGGTAKSGPGLLPNPTTITCTYTAVQK